MLITREFKDYEDKIRQYVVVDLRSPAEFRSGHIPGALNIPLFDNDERAHIGTIYKQSGRAEATRLGIFYISRKLPDFYNGFQKLLPAKFLLYCARGGMRSESVGGLLSSVGLQVSKIKDGYKGYRNHILSELPLLTQRFEFVTLYGKTGTGKTQVLHALKDAGADVLDLERCANHRGSLLGSIGLTGGQSQKQFESNIYLSLRTARSDTVITEGESRKIGSVCIPKELMTKMAGGRKMLLEAGLERRIEVIKQDYRPEYIDKSDLLEHLGRLSKYISREQLDIYRSQIENGSFDEVVEGLMLNYYDKVYNTKGLEYERTFQCDLPGEAAKEILNHLAGRV